MQSTSLDDLDDLDLDDLEVEESVIFVASNDIDLYNLVDLDDFDVYVQSVDLDDFAFDDFEEDHSLGLFVALTFMRLTSFG